MKVTRFFAIAASAMVATFAAAQASPVSLIESDTPESPFVDFDNEDQENAGLLKYGIDVTSQEFYAMTINGRRLSDFSLADEKSLMLGSNRELTALVIDLSKYWGNSISDTVRAIEGAVANRQANKAEFDAFAALSDAETLTNPIPASFILFLCGGAGVIGAARRKIQAAI